jgi:hypothetical protein
VLNPAGQFRGNAIFTTPSAAISDQLTGLYEGIDEASKPSGVFGPPVRISGLMELLDR